MGYAERVEGGRGRTSSSISFESTANSTAYDRSDFTHITYDAKNGTLG